MSGQWSVKNHALLVLMAGLCVGADALAQSAPRTPPALPLLPGFTASPSEQSRTARMRAVLRQMGSSVLRLKDRCTVIGNVSLERLEATAIFFNNTAAQIPEEEDLAEIIRMVIAVTDSGNILNIAPDIAGRSGLRAIVLRPQTGTAGPVEILVPGRSPLGDSRQTDPQELKAQWLAVKESLRHIARLGRDIEGRGPWIGSHIPARGPGSSAQVGWQEATGRDIWVQDIQNTGCDDPGAAAPAQEN